ncbi:restriction endonuclease subunit S [Providencia hangzhouensis]|uniref:Restriction endonuclease subunit S n=1 Tax=Providencia hangzhouensis TaxID=3031799 RepID=A0ABY9Z8A2_9GAMM|nr:restriction endonuclease subunit S [Providencia hangzhouensis]WNK23943.1 restriction endonuclease subunit S [Providencia hangzhouensis]
MMPEGWKVVTLGEVIHESAFGPRFSAELYSDNGNVGAIRTTDLDSEGNIDYKTIPYANLPDSFETHYLKSNDLLITRSGTCGIPCLFEKQDKPIIAGAFLIRFILKDNVHPKYIHSLLKSEHLQRDIHNLSSGGVQKNLSGTNLKKLKFILPPLLEQKKIAQIFSNWDMAIATTERLLANSQQQKKALRQQLLTGKKRFPEFNGKWERKELGELLEYKQPTPYLVNSTDYNDDYDIPVLTAGKTFILGYTNELEGIYRGKLPVIIFDDFTTDSKFVDFPFKAKSSAMKILTARDGVSIKYVFEAMQMLDFKIGGHQRHWISIFSNQVIAIPEIAEQRKIASALSCADGEIETLKQKLNHLKQEKKALMQQLLTGKRRVKVDAA